MSDNNPFRQACRIEFHIDTLQSNLVGINVKHIYIRSYHCTKLASEMVESIENIQLFLCYDINCPDIVCFDLILHISYYNCITYFTLKYFGKSYLIVDNQIPQTPQTTKFHEHPKYTQVTRITKTYYIQLSLIGNHNQNN